MHKHATDVSSSKANNAIIQYFSWLGLTAQTGEKCGCSTRLSHLPTSGVPNQLRTGPKSTMRVVQRKRKINVCVCVYIINIRRYVLVYCTDFFFK